MGNDLPRATPAEQFVDPAAVLAFVEAVDADPSVEVHSLMVVRHGHVVAEGWWAPHTPERTRLLYSLSKSFTSAALGFALQEGLVRLDDPVVSYFPEFDKEITDPGSRSITLRHVASMAGGHDRDMLDEALARDPAEPVRGFLLIPPDEEPGSRFAYSQPCTYTVATVIQRLAGMRLTEYLRPRLFDPLGIGEVGWQSWPPGREQGFSGLFARTEDIAKLGQLYLRGGRWGGRRLLPSGYVTEATTRQIGTPNEPNPDWRQGYGFQFWMSRHGYRGDGAFGQFCVVLPEREAVVAITAGTEEMQAVLDHLWKHLLPGLGADTPDTDTPDTDTPDTDAQEDLDKRLRDLRLPPCVAEPNPPSWPEWTFLAAAAGDTPLTSVGLDRADHGLEVTITEPDNAVTFPVGAGDWQVSEPRNSCGDPVPVAASGGWLDGRTLRVELIFLESPHRMDIVCALPSRTAEATWRTQPLVSGKLRDLRRPR